MPVSILTASNEELGDNVNRGLPTASTSEDGEDADMPIPQAMKKKREYR